MEIAPVSVACSFEVTYDSPTLHVGMSVYDDSGSSPVLVQGPTAMLNVVGNTYRAKFTPPALRPYIIFKAVYTDSGLTTLSPDYSQGSESIIAQSTGGAATSNSTGCSVVGVIDSSHNVVGFVNC